MNSVFWIGYELNDQEIVILIRAQAGECFFPKWSRVAQGPTHIPIQYNLAEYLPE